MRHRGIIAIALAAIVAGAAGCGAEGTGGERVSGQVTLDGKPLESGSITFMPADPNAGLSPVEARIEDGAFDLAAARGPRAGAYLVSISAPVAGPPAAKGRRAPGRNHDATSGTGAEDAPAEAATHESIPDRYNTATTLKADITQGGVNALDYALTTR